MKRAAKIAAAMGLTVAVATLTVPAFAQDSTPATPTTPTTAPAAGTTTDPNQAPADNAAPAAGASGGITLGTGAPKKDAVTPAKKEEEKKAPKPRPFAGSQIFIMNSMSTTTFVRDQQQYSNPTIETSAFILPRYTISKDWQVRGRTTIAYEYTNSDTTQTRNEFRFGDSGLQLFYRGIPAFAGIKPQVAIGVTVPTSPESRARTMIATPALSIQLAKSFEKFVGEGELDVLLLGSYSHPFYTNTTAGIRGDAPYQRLCAGGGGGCADQLTGAANASDILSYSAIVAASWGPISPAFWFNMSHQFVYTFKDQDVQLAGSGTATPGRLSDASTVRNATYFSFWVDVEATHWLTAEVGYFMSRNVLRADGKYGNPFFDANQDMRVYLGANVNLDNLAKAIEGTGGDGGVVRAKNRTGPALGAY